VRLIADLSHELGIQTIAEFVEQEDVLDQVRGLGIDYAQGFLLGRPAPRPCPPREARREPEAADVT
jgi:EAL domain-containing protein (putative c-di-GMP-specific phosphodiesterase class I)